jgi:putative spermidine/putrescine transport system ATP-binding protein
LVRLAGVEDRYARELSGGQKQRVALARATVYRPQLLLMDEPLSALDKKLRDEMQLELRRIHQDLGTSVLYVTHDQGEALALSSRVVLMRDGMIEQEGSPSDVYQNPKTVFAASFLGEANQLRGRVVRRQEGATAVVELSNGRLVLGRTEMGPEAPPDVVVVVRPEDVELVDAADAGALRVELADAVYMGNRIRYSGTFETGEPAVLSLDRGRAGLLAMTGEAYVRWNAPDATVIPVRQGDEPAPASESEHPGLLGRE